MKYDEIFTYNEHWIAGKLAEDPGFFSRMCVAQEPDYLFIGCSDSRAAPEEITGLNLGQVFVHRNIANIVNPIDLNVASVIEYGIENLDVKHIIVCGHYGCGGISAAMEQEGIGKNSPWLQIIKDINRIHQQELVNIESTAQRYDRLVELNVLEQCENVLEMECVKKRYAKKGHPAVHGWVYDMRTGRIIDLRVDHKAAFRKLGADKPYSLRNMLAAARGLIRRK